MHHLPSEGRHHNKLRCNSLISVFAVQRRSGGRGTHLIADIFSCNYSSLELATKVGGREAGERWRKMRGRRMKSRTRAAERHPLRCQHVSGRAAHTWMCYKDWKAH